MEGRHVERSLVPVEDSPDAPNVGRRARRCRRCRRGTRSDVERTDVCQRQHAGDDGAEGDDDTEPASHPGATSGLSAVFDISGVNGLIWPTGGDTRVGEEGPLRVGRSLGQHVGGGLGRRRRWHRLRPEWRGAGRHRRSRRSGALSKPLQKPVHRLGGRGSVRREGSRSDRAALG